MREREKMSRIVRLTLIGDSRGFKYKRSYMDIISETERSYTVDAKDLYKGVSISKNKLDKVTDTAIKNCHRAAYFTIVFVEIGDNEMNAKNKLRKAMSDFMLDKKRETIWLNDLAGLNNAKIER